MEQSSYKCMLWHEIVQDSLVLALYLVSWVTPWESYLTTSSLGFHICEMKILKMVVTL